MAHEYRPEQSTAWATIAVILLVVVAILLIGYFAWWAPAQRDIVVVPQEREIEREREIIPAPQPEQGQPIEREPQDTEGARGL